MPTTTTTTTKWLLPFCFILNEILKISFFTFLNLSPATHYNLALKLCTTLPKPVTAEENCSAHYILLYNNFKAVLKNATTTANDYGHRAYATRSHSFVCGAYLRFYFLKLCRRRKVAIKFHCFFKMLVVIVSISTHTQPREQNKQRREKKKKKG